MGGIPLTARKYATVQLHCDGHPGFDLAIEEQHYETLAIIIMALSQHKYTKRTMFWEGSL